MVRKSLTEKKNSGFTSLEFIYIFATGILAGFFLSFDDWGVDEYNIAAGLENFLIATFAVLLILFVVLIAQKKLGSLFGYQISYQYSGIGLLLGFFITFFSFGAFPFFLPGGINYDLVKTARIGKYHQGHKHSEMFFISSLAVIIPMFFALFFGGFFLSTGENIFRHITIAALLFGLFALLPAPQFANPGKHNTRSNSFKYLRGATFGYDLFTFHQPGYILLGLTFLAFAGLILLFEVFSLVLSVIVAILVLFMYKFLLKYLKS